MSACSAELSQAGTAGDEIFSVLPTEQRDKPPFPCAVLGTSLTRRRDGAARRWVHLITGSRAQWWRLCWVPAGASLRDGDNLSFKFSAALFSVTLLGNCNMPSSGVVRISSGFHGGSREGSPEHGVGSAEQTRRRFGRLLHVARPADNSEAQQTTR